METKEVFKYLITLAIGFASSYFFYTKTKIDGLEGNLQLSKGHLIRCENEKESLKKNGDVLQIAVKKSEIEIEYKLKEIDYLNKNLDDKNTAIDELNSEIKIKEDRIEKMLYDLKKVIEEGATEETKEKIKSLYTEIEDLKKYNLNLKNEKKHIIEEVKSIRKQLLNKEKEHKILAEVKIPAMSEQIVKLNKELEIASEFKEFLNIRAEIENIILDKKNNTLQFDLVFDNEEINFLKNYPDFSKIIFNTKIVNESEKIVLSPRLNDFDAFAKRKNELTEFITITYPINNYDLKKYRNGKKGVNLVKGDIIKIKVIIDELYGIEIANKSFRLR